MRLYNDTYNNLRPRLFDGSHLDFPGMNQHIKLRPHQDDAVWRGMSSGNTLLAHTVGAGKTFTMAATGMKMKQAGLIKKPMYVVPNHLLEQFSREFMQLYPNAKLLVAAKEDLSRDRRKFLNRSIFCNIPQGVSQFTASFTYKASGTNYYNPGTSFVLQNSAAGASALSSGAFGYSGLAGASAALTFETSDCSGLYTNGNVGGGSPYTSPVDLFVNDPINVTLAYNGTLLQESLLDTTTRASYSASYLINLPTLLGGPTAYVGFTTTTGGYGLDQTISNFQFNSTAVPEPASLGIVLVGFGVLAARRRRGALR